LRARRAKNLIDGNAEDQCLVPMKSAISFRASASPRANFFFLRQPCGLRRIGLRAVSI
jgi:hypothetical protein